NLGFQGKITKAVETGFGFEFNAAVEQVDGCKIARVLQRPTQGESSPGTAVVVLRCPVIAPAPDGRQRDRVVANQRVGLQTLAKCREVAQGRSAAALLLNSLTWPASTPSSPAISLYHSSREPPC